MKLSIEKVLFHVKFHLLENWKMKLSIESSLKGVTMAPTLKYALVDDRRRVYISGEGPLSFFCFSILEA